MKEESTTRRVDVLIKTLKDAVAIKAQIRGAKSSVKRIRAKERISAKWDARASEAEERRAKAMEELEAVKSEAEADAKQIAEAEAKVKSAEADKAKFTARAAYIRTLDLDLASKRLVELKEKRESLINSAMKLIGEIGGYRRRDRAEVRRLAAAVGIRFW